MLSRQKFLSIQDIAETLGVHRSSVSRMLARGDIASVQIGDSPRVDPEDFRAWIEAGKAASLERAEAARRAAEPRRPVGRPRKPGIGKPQPAAVAAADV